MRSTTALNWRFFETLLRTGAILGEYLPFKSGTQTRGEHLGTGEVRRFQICGGDDPIAHDGPTPPEPGKDYAFRCSITSRLQLVNPTRLVWTFTTDWICNPVRMEEQKATELLRFGRSRRIEMWIS